jgi:hypothetical protein
MDAHKGLSCVCCARFLYDDGRHDSYRDAVGVHCGICAKQQVNPDGGLSKRSTKKVLRARFERESEPPTAPDHGVACVCCGQPVYGNGRHDSYTDAAGVHCSICAKQKVNPDGAVSKKRIMLVLEAHFERESEPRVINYYHERITRIVCVRCHVRLGYNIITHAQPTARHYFKGDMYYNERSGFDYCAPCVNLTAMKHQDRLWVALRCEHLHIAHDGCTPVVTLSRRSTHTRSGRAISDAERRRRARRLWGGVLKDTI